MPATLTVHAKDEVLAEHVRLLAAVTAENASPYLLTRVVGQGRKQPLFDTGRYTFQKLLGDCENIAPTAVAEMRHRNTASGSGAG